jgi:hypothetical protein
MTNGFLFPLQKFDRILRPETMGNQPQASWQILTRNVKKIEGLDKPTSEKKKTFL